MNFRYFWVPVQKRVFEDFIQGVGNGIIGFWTPEIMPFQMVYTRKEHIFMSGASFFKAHRTEIFLYYWALFAHLAHGYAEKAVT